ncbi:hypothetical protein LOK49_LG13G02600 [Camellia lanceoleosa]|uniref:Uncharacterized protein n=1 Tax=Camellia lanceoleosa TaxID=1840588 RepID=A0ACC0FIL9_9ERIC|nr:hypothetical protein LOK49_LG13G02600 [Camellia lanceoleosa]
MGEIISEDYELEYGIDCLEMHLGVVQPGECVLVIDDLVATGGTLSAAIRLLEQSLFIWSFLNSKAIHDGTTSWMSVLRSSVLTDVILETLSIRLALLNASTCQHDSVGVLNAKQGLKLPISVLTPYRFGLISEHWEDVDGEAFDAAVDVCIGEINPLENAVKQSKRSTGRAEAAQATVDQVKVEGIDTNLAAMKELLFRLIESFNCLQVLATWQDPWKSTMFLVMISYSIFR